VGDERYCRHGAIITGKNGNRLDPQANMTRAEVAAVIQRLLKRSGLI
jgi:hypothetical protein